MKTENKIKGINVLNPVEVEKDYLLYTVEYAHKNGFNQIQINGPIHDVVKGNIDGMTPYRKYNSFENQKDCDYVKKSMDAINEACDVADKYGIRIFVWHHELAVPTGFTKMYPEVCNDYGDIEVSHPIIRDFLENKIKDFFHFYPGVAGIVLTLHETKIPLLKLKHQMLEKVERVKYVTQILYDECKKLGKELIVRPFASLEEDYEMMSNAYEEISEELPIMDKWTQFDWSLTLPHNAFFNKIKKNPLVVEADIFGEYFGKGMIPIMLKKHLKGKFEYCEKYTPIGYVSRIDRAGSHMFGDVNEVNAVMTIAYLNGNDPDVAAMDFFKGKYPDAYKEVYDLMEKTEEIQEKTMYLKGYYFSELSIFPSLNHSKNHYYFEQMRKDCYIESNEWYIPHNWKRSEPEELIKEKLSAKEDAKKLLLKLESLEGKIERAEYEKLWTKFSNLKYVTAAWYELTLCFINYVRYFETFDSEYEREFYEKTQNLLKIRDYGKETLGDKFYCMNNGYPQESGRNDYIGRFADEIIESFEIEKDTTNNILKKGNITDFVVCGGAMEGHALKKEVNFSDTIISDGGMYRITGNRNGLKWSSINAHGWFSYKLKVIPEKENIIKVSAGAVSGNLNIKVTLGDKEYIVNKSSAEKTELEFTYKADREEDFVRIRFDKISVDMPCIYTIVVTPNKGRRF